MYVHVPIVYLNITRIENVQRRFTKHYWHEQLEYEQRLKVLKLPNLECRRAIGDMTESFKSVNGFYEH